MKTKGTLALPAIRTVTITNMKFWREKRILSPASKTIGSCGHGEKKASQATIHPDQPRVSRHVNDNYCLNAPVCAC